MATTINSLLTTINSAISANSATHCEGKGKGYRMQCSCFVSIFGGILTLKALALFALFALFNQKRASSPSRLRYMSRQ